MIVVNIILLILFLIMAALLLLLPEEKINSFLEKRFSGLRNCDVKRVRLLLAVVLILYAVIEIIVLANQKSTFVLIVCIILDAVFMVAAGAAFDKFCRKKKRRASVRTPERDSSGDQKNDAEVRKNDAEAGNNDAEVGKNDAGIIAEENRMGDVVASDISGVSEDFIEKMLNNDDDEEILD